MLTNMNIAFECGFYHKVIKLKITYSLHSYADDFKHFDFQ